MTKEDLEAVLAAFNRDMERAAQEYVAAVGRALAPLYQSLQSTVDALLERACPRREPHPEHSWRFPDSESFTRCPGVRAEVEQVCMISYNHGAHGWFPEALGGQEARWCPGVKASARCPLDGALCADTDPHPSHDMEGGHCHGRVRGHAWENNRVITADVEPCARTESHPLHVWTLDLPEGGHRWCRGKVCFPATVVVKRCPNGKAHDSHNWEDQDDGRTLKACPGRRIWDTNLVPAGPDRSA